MLTNKLFNDIYATLKLLKEQADKLVGNEELSEKAKELMGDLRVVANIEEDYALILKKLLNGLNCIYGVAEQFTHKDTNFLGTIEIAIARRSTNKILAFELLTNGRQLMDQLTEIVIRNGGNVYLPETFQAIDREISRLRGL